MWIGMKLLKQMQVQNIKKNKASPGSMHEAGCSGLVHWDDPEGWNGEGDGRGDRDREHM